MSAIGTKRGVGSTARPCMSDKRKFEIASAIKGTLHTLTCAEQQR